MIKDDMTPNRYRICFLDGDIERTHYADDRRYYERLVAQHGHLSSLQVEPVVLTTAQQQRLDEIKGAGLSGHDASLYVRYGTVDDESSVYYDEAGMARYQHDQVEPAIRAQRKRAEDSGVVHNGIRYAGDAANRQTLQEALMYAEDANVTVFPAWKDSDGQHHADVPVADVEAALRKIGQRRNALITLEAQYIAQAAAGEVDILELEWATPHDSI